jgi:hypothetical protein
MFICYPYLVFVLCVTCDDPYNETWTGYPHLDDGFLSETVSREDDGGFLSLSDRVAWRIIFVCVPVCLVHRAFG